MKTRVLYLFAAVLVLFSCTNENIATVLPDTDEFYCSIENEGSTRTSLDQNNNVTWSADDQLVIFKKSSIPSKYQISESHVGKTSGSFYKINSDEFNAGSELDHNVALYPYQENMEITKLDSDSPTSNYKITGYTFPAEQTYAENSFANGAFPMAAISDNSDLTFRNICGGIKLQLKGTQKVKSIDIIGKNDEILAGRSDIIICSDAALVPAIFMATDASTLITLDCAEGIQLNNSTETEFIIALPPTVFRDGFEIIITDEYNKTYLLETSATNAVARSSLLVMPALTLENLDEDNDKPESQEIPVTLVYLSPRELNLYEGECAKLELTIRPENATNKDVIWYTHDSNVVTVSDKGEVTAISSGTTTISADVGGFVKTCRVIVVARPTINEYIDEYGVNHGEGITIGTMVWSPVNCGYHKTDYPYGKLYQWGRKYGQGYDRNDATIPTFIEIVDGDEIYPTLDIDKKNKDAFYVHNNEWMDASYETLWNQGLESAPIKTSYDPCPSGWRVPTKTELRKLAEHMSEWTTNEMGQNGYWFSGATSYSADAPQIFLPAAGHREYWGDAEGRNSSGYYWTTTWGDYHGYGIYFSSKKIDTLYGASRASGLSIRCIQE